MQSRVLVTHGSKRGGTAEIAEAIAGRLRSHGLAVDCVPAETAPAPDDYDAVIVGGALYMNRWHAAARRFVARHVANLEVRPTWLFSSGPLDRSASTREIAPVRQVTSLMRRIGARGHVTFGGRLAPDAQGFVAAAMARTRAGDWRDREQIDAWADEIANVLVVMAGRPRRKVLVPARWPLVAPTVAACVIAAAGGYALVAHHGGTLSGLVLLGIGTGAAVTSLLAIWRSYFTELAAFTLSGAAILWTAIAVMLLGTFHVLHGLVLGAAILIFSESLRRLTRYGAA